MSPNEKTLDKHRRAARVVLLDQDDRVLLLSSWLEWRDCIIWLAPGGALEDGESFEAAARRECWEETGLELDGALPHVWNREHTWMWKGREIHTRERYFFKRVDGFEPDAPELEEYEETLFRGHKWWTIDGLRDLDDLVAPESLAELLAPLAAGEIPDVPKDV